MDLEITGFQPAAGGVSRAIKDYALVTIQRSHMVLSAAFCHKLQAGAPLGQIYDHAEMSLHHDRKAILLQFFDAKLYPNGLSALKKNASIFKLRRNGGRLTTPSLSRVINCANVIANTPWLAQIAQDPDLAAKRFVPQLFDWLGDDPSWWEVRTRPDDVIQAYEDWNNTCVVSPDAANTGNPLIDPSSPQSLMRRLAALENQAYEAEKRAQALERAIAKIEYKHLWNKKVALCQKCASSPATLQTSKQPKKSTTSSPCHSCRGAAPQGSRR